MTTRLISDSLFRYSVAVILAGLLASPWAAPAANKTWNCTSSYWDIASCWSPTGVPLPADDVTAGPVSATNTFLRFDSVTGTRAAYSLLINSDTVNTIGFLQTGGSLTIIANEIVGSTGTGSYALSGGGNEAGDLYLGQNSGSNGTYTLSGTGSLQARRSEYIGNFGTGSFTQSGGTNSINGGLNLGNGTTGNGTYNLSGGNLSASSERIGEYGTGSFTQSGGTNTVIYYLYLGLRSGSNGTYNLNNGTLNVDYIVNSDGTGTLNLDGGTLNVGNSIDVDIFRVGNAVGSNASYTLIAGKSLTAGTEYIGASGTGSFTQSGGTHTVSNRSLYLGYSSGGNGTYSLSGGDLSVLSPYYDEYIGYSGTGSFTQSGGTHTVSSSLYLGRFSGSNGTYDLSGTGTLTADHEVIGNYGTGSFTQSGGTHKVNFSLDLGRYSGSNGTYTLSGGTLNVGHDIANSDGTGTLNLDGGTLNVGNSIDVDIFRVGNAVGSNGSYTLIAGKSLTAGTEYIGASGTGSFTQSSGMHSIGGDLTLAANSGSSGTYTLSGGAFNVGGNVVNGAGSSTFNLNGGMLSVGGSSIAADVFRIGSVAGSNGSFTLSSGKTLSAVSEDIGYFGTGNLAQSGGTHAVSSNLYLGHYATGHGTYSLDAGNLSAPNQYIGFDGTGTFTQGGGANAASNYFFIAYNSGSNGTYNLSGTGSLVAYREFIGNYGIGTFNQSDGENRVSTGLYVGNSTGGTGSYSLSGAGSLLTTANEYIGYFGTGSFFQNGGTHTVSDNLALGSQSTGNGTYTLSGGTLNVGGNIVNGTGSSTLVFDGGVLNVGGSSIGVNYFYIGNATGSSVSYTLSAGKTLMAVTEAIGGSGTGTFTQNGGTNTVTGNVVIAQNPDGHGTYHLAGGTLTAANVINNDALNYTGGALNANVQNAGVFNLSGAGVHIVSGDVVNTGAVKVTNTVAVFNGSYTESGHLAADPATLIFTDVVINETGYWLSNLGDSFFVSGDFENHSLQGTLWSTADASLILNGSDTQDLYLAGADLGALFSGYANNFAWGDFTLGSGVSVHLWDGNTDPDAALYVGLFEVSEGLGQLANIFSDFNIYYDPNLAGNAYLGGQSYALNGLGFLMPAAVPVPPAVWLFGSGLLGLVAVARRRKV